MPNADGEGPDKADGAWAAGVRAHLRGGAGQDAPGGRRRRPPTAGCRRQVLLDTSLAGPFAPRLLQLRKSCASCCGVSGGVTAHSDLAAGHVQQRICCPALPGTILICSTT